jgi:undecaprenyl-diphosphatase
MGAGTVPVRVQEILKCGRHTDAMDLDVVHALNSLLAGHDGIEDPLSLYVAASELLFLLGIVALFALARGRRRADLRRAATAAGLSAGLALLAAQVVSRLVDRPRPFVAHPDQIQLFAKHAADPGFPSDHATAAFAIATALLLRDRRLGAGVLVLATVLGVGRVAIGVHYPSDVLGGAVLGAACALVLWAPPVRALLHRLADAAGRLWDGALAAVARLVHPCP